MTEWAQTTLRVHFLLTSLDILASLSEHEVQCRSDRRFEFLSQVLYRTATPLLLYPYHSTHTFPNPYADFFELVNPPGTFEATGNIKSDPRRVT